ncbi:hypothetical protein B0H21DRAFT_215584 [Amylocystis lapponica]|nr:hypothetical protein B0H21DRAFT_215584 [Amylocystis lapponica]
MGGVADRYHRAVVSGEKPGMPAEQAWDTHRAKKFRTVQTQGFSECFTPKTWWQRIWFLCARGDGLQTICIARRPQNEARKAFATGQRRRRNRSVQRMWSSGSSPDNHRRAIDSFVHAVEQILPRTELAADVLDGAPSGPVQWCRRRLQGRREAYPHICGLSGGGSDRYCTICQDKVPAEWFQGVGVDAHLVIASQHVRSQDPNSTSAT